MKFILILLLLIVLLVVGFSIAAAVIAWLVVKWVCIVAFIFGFVVVGYATDNMVLGAMAGVVCAICSIVLLLRSTD